MGSAPLVLTRESDPPRDVVNAISDGLDHYNAGFFPGAWTGGFFVGRDATGAVAAGLKFVTALEWLFVEWLWVAEPLRKQGEGSRLLREAEAEARAQGLTGVYLDTFSFQAPRFYEKHGYREFGRIADFPSGHARIWLMKRF